MLKELKMSKIINSQVISYLKTSPRNRIIIHQGKFDELAYLDIGVEFSKLLKPIVNTKHLSFKAQNLLNDLLLSFISKHLELGEILSLTNYGILFEKELNIDIIAMFDKYSKNLTLILDWQGEIENDILYYLDKQSNIKIDMNSINHLII